MKKFLLPLLACFLLSACGKSDTVTIDTGSGKALEVQTYNTVMGTKHLTDPVHGKETQFAYGAVSGVEGTKANGVTYLHTFADGVSVLTVNVNILPVPGKHFIAWATDEAGMSYTYAGELESVLNDARHTVTLTTKQEVKNLARVVVTIESSVHPGSAGQHAAEATLKVVKK